MRKCCRIISSFVLFTFFLSAIGVDFSLSIGVTGATHRENEIKTLSPVLKFSKLAGIEPKEMVRVELAIESALLYMSQGDDEIDTAKLIEYVNNYNDSSVFDDTHIFFAEREILDNGKIIVKARVKAEGGKVLRTYYAVFSTKRENGGFDVRACKEKEWKENKEIIRHGKDLPKRETQQPEDAKAMARYKNDNEKTIDKFIEDCIYDGDFAEIEGRTSVYPMMRPRVFFPKIHMRYIKNQLDRFLKIFGTNINTALDDKNLIFLKVSKEKSYPVIDEESFRSGELVPVQVMSHTSKNAVYIFLDEFVFNCLKEKKRQLESIHEYVLPHIIYGIGVIYGLEYKVDEFGLTMNDLLEAYLMYRRGVSLEKIKESFPNLELKEKVNLDETLWTRDYAMGGIIKAEQNVEANRVALAKEIAGYSNKATIEETEGVLLEEVIRRLEIYSLKAIIWYLVAGQNLTSPGQLDNVRTTQASEWKGYTEIDAKLDKFLRERVIEWINIQVKTKGSTIFKEMAKQTIVTRAWAGPSYVSVSYDQEKAIITRVLKPTIEEIFGCDYYEFSIAQKFSKQMSAYLSEDIELQSLQNRDDKKIESKDARYDIEVLKECADKAGKFIAPPVSRYALFTAYDLARDEEYEKDAEKYKSRFRLERIPTDKLEEIIDKILQTMRDKKLRPEDVIVQLPIEFSRNPYDIDKLMNNAPGIKIMIIDTKGLKEEKDESEREKYRDVVYSIMLLARNIDEKATPMVYGLLRYFVEYCFKDSENNAQEINRYMELLTDNNLLEILKVALSYEYMKKQTLPDRALIAKTLVSA